MNTSFRIPIALALFVAVSAGCHRPPPQVEAPTPNVVLRAQRTGNFDVVVAGATDDVTCSVASGAKDVCVTHLKAGIRHGVRSLLHEYIRPGAGAKYTAIFTMVEYRHALYNLFAAGLSMRWRFVLADDQRRPVLAITGTTHAPNPMNDPKEAGRITKDLLNAVMEEIGGELNKLGSARGGETAAAHVAAETN